MSWVAASTSTLCCVLTVCCAVLCDTALWCVHVVVTRSWSSWMDSPTHACAPSGKPTPRVATLPLPAGPLNRQPAGPTAPRPSTSPARRRGCKTSASPSVHVGLMVGAPTETTTTTTCQRCRFQARATTQVPRHSSLSSSRWEASGYRLGGKRSRLQAQAVLCPAPAGCSLRRNKWACLDSRVRLCQCRHHHRLLRQHQRQRQRLCQHEHLQQREH